MAASSLPQNAVGYLKDLHNAGQSLSILVIGESGSGKTFLVNSLLGEKIAEEEEEKTSAISTFTGTVQKVSVTVYEATDLIVEDEQHQKEVQELLNSRSLSFILYCFKMSETRMRQSLINTIKVFHRAGVDWNKTVIALTFADSLPVPKAQRNDPKYDEKQYFTSRLNEWKGKVTDVLTSKVGVPKETAGHIAMIPTAGDPEEMLPTEEKWCSPLWSAVLAVTAQTQPSMSMKHRYTTSDNVNTSKLDAASHPTATQCHTLPASSGQQIELSYRRIVTLCVLLITIGSSIAFGGILPGAIVAAVAVVFARVFKRR